MSDFELALVLPLEDPRGDIAEHLRSWAEGQTLDRDRYQVVVGADGRHPDFERQVASVLAPQDEVVRVPGASMMELYRAAAAAAGAEVLVLTEAHCHGQPECLETVAEAFAADPELGAATLTYTQNATSPLAELTERWFERVFSAWDRGGWRRFNNAGVAIRRDVYERAGGIDPSLEIYATSFLSARLHEQGVRSVHLDGAVLVHELEDTMEEALGASRSFARGECAVRLRNEPEFCQRYFGPAGLWERRLAYRPELARTMIAAVIDAIRVSRSDAPWLGRELAGRLPAGLAGAYPRWAWEAASARALQGVTQFAALPAETRWRSYVSAQDRAVRSVQLLEGATGDGLPDGLEPGEGEVRALQLGDRLVGAGGVESRDGREFRWTEPVAMLRVSMPDAGGAVRVATGGLRGEPIAYLAGAYCGGSRVPAEMIGCDAEGLEVRLTPELAREASAKGLVLLARPLVPSRTGSSDPRRLGIPIVAVELTGAYAGSGETAAPSAAAAPSPAAIS